MYWLRIGGQGDWKVVVRRGGWVEGAGLRVNTPHNYYYHHQASPAIQPPHHPLDIWCCQPQPYCIMYTTQRIQVNSTTAYKRCSQQQNRLKISRLPKDKAQLAQNFHNWFYGEKIQIYWGYSKIMVQNWTILFRDVNQLIVCQMMDRVCLSVCFDKVIMSQLHSWAPRSLSTNGFYNARKGIWCFRVSSY